MVVVSISLMGAPEHSFIVNRCAAAVQYLLIAEREVTLIVNASLALVVNTSDGSFIITQI